jgi:hypothetical protein
MATEPATRQVADKVLLMAPSIGSWKGRYQLPKELVTVELAGNTVDTKKITTPCTKLMSDTCPVDGTGAAWKKRFDRLESRLSAVLDRYSVPFPIIGVRLVPERVGIAFLSAIDDIRRDQTATVAAFIRDFEDVIRQIRESADPAIWKHIVKKVPKDQIEMRAKFYLDVIPIQLAHAAGEPSAVSLQDLEANQELVRTSVARAVGDAVRALVEDPLDQLVGKLSSLRELIDRDGRVTTRSFGPVREALAKVRDFMLVPNETLMQTITELEGRMNITVAKDLDSITAARNGFTALLDSVIAEASDETQRQEFVERYGRQLRYLNI